MKKAMKRACAVTLSAALAFSFMTFTAASAAAYTAQEPAEIYSYELDVTLGGEYDAAGQAIYEAIKNCETTVDVKGLGVTTSNATAIYAGVLNTHPDVFYVDNSASYSYYSSSGEVVKYNISYSYDTSEIPALKEEFDSRVNEITALVSDDMTDLEKAVVLHDELAASCDYDQTYQKANAYNAIVEGSAVCQGYSYAYAYLLSLVGVQSEYASSDSMNHMWNKVCIDGAWYNVDVTWDDPVSVTRGQANHTYFLLSDNKISSDGYKHYDYVSVHEADDTSFDDALLHELDTRLCKVSGSYYAVCNGSDDTYAKSLVKYDLASDTAEVAEQFDCKWSAGGGYYTDAYMALWAYGGLLYFNTPEALCSYDVRTGEQSTVVENVLDDTSSDSTCACYGIVIKYGDVYAAIAESAKASDNEVKLVKSLAAIGERAKPTLSDGTTASLYYGDADSDGTISIADVTYVQKALARITSFDEGQKIAADVNSDGTINIKDATDIQMYIAGIV